MAGHGSDSILIADGDARAAALGRALEAQGYSVVLARTGADALRAAAGEPLAVALVALTLRDVSPMDVVKALQRDADPAEVIFVADRAGRASALAAAEAGAAAYLVKPIDPVRLGGIVRGIVERRRLAREDGRLFEQAEHERRRLHVVYEVSRRLAAAQDTEQILSLLVNEATRLLDAQAAGIRLLGRGSS